MLTIVLRTTVKTITNCCNNVRDIDGRMPSREAYHPLHAAIACTVLPLNILRLRQYSFAIFSL